MAIDIALWRLTIGTFYMKKLNTSTTMNDKEATIFSKFNLRKLHIKSSNRTHGLLILLFLTVAAMTVSTILTICMDIESNPGPTDTETDSTSPVTATRFKFTNLFNRTKRIKLKLTRYEHHLVNFTFYKEHGIIPRSLFSSLSPLNSSNETFYRRWNYISHFTARRYLRLLIKECKNIISNLVSDYNLHLENLQRSCTSEVFEFYIFKLNSMTSSLKNVLANRRALKTSFLRNKSNNTSNQINSVNANNTNHITTENNAINNPITNKKQRTRRKNKSFTFVSDANSVINLSQTALSTDEISVLSRGLTFCPTPKHINWTEISADVLEFSRRVRLTEFFYDNNINNPSGDRRRFRNKSTWTPPTDREPCLNTFLDAVKLDISNMQPKRVTDNLSSNERLALRNLKQRQDIVIKPADKGSGTVVMDKSWYIEECNRQLNDTKFYKKLQDDDLTTNIQLRVKTYVNRMYRDEHIDEKTKTYLIQSDPKPGRFYILPKIHKAGNPGRPIVSSNSHPTERISEFVDYHLQPLVSKLPSYVKDTNDFLNKLKLINNLPTNTLLVTLDVSSLYTNIPHNDGIDACYNYLNTRPNKTIPSNTLCDLIRMILTMNNFCFNNNHYLQIHGTAMGTKMAPSFANLFLGCFETNALNNAPFKPHTWLRYIDDIFMIWTEGLNNLEIFINYLNNIHSTIKFTSSHSATNVPFLDVNVYLDNGAIQTDLYCKPTDKHQHLLYSSCHPLHTKKAIPFSLALRLRRICSTDHAFNIRTAELTSYLLKRGYNRNFLSKQINRAANIPRDVALQPKQKNTSTRIPLILTYNPSFPSISSIIKKHLNLLYSSKRSKTVFAQPPLVAFRRSSNLRDMLVKAQLPSTSLNHNDTPTPPGSYRCGLNCLTCKYIADGQTSYTFTATGETRNINSNMTCNTSNIIYMVQCTKCNLQYIGETKRRLKDRFNEHRRAVDKPNTISKPTAVSEHFLTTNHSASDMLLIPIQKLYSARDSIRKAREAFLITKANTLEPNGLNKRDESY